MQKKKNNRLLTVILIILAGVFILFPLYILVSTALKSPEDMMKSTLALPTTFHFDNFTQAIKLTNFFDAFTNTAVITCVSVVFIIISNSMVAYAIARNQNIKYFNLLYYYFLSAMFVPFQIIMLPLVKQVSALHLDNVPGIIILYIVYGLPINTFLYVGYLKSLPKSLEEAATIDGATIWQVFFRIIFPLLKPINATVGILAFLGCWNDFMLPLVILSKPEQATLSLVQYIFQGQFSTNYNLAFASYLLALLPIIIVYVFAQRFIISGVTNGAIKQ
ncbi:carbohydrate ABC transporter permease [Clostridium bowmanii]|uniref:carbohydrate ABC transporter permease n=1 Tax=Clostridium bowmanii TaxID=132925 RepID=UPI001C0B6A1B|nr:carbohydrate ABC transporter permease [Clostridium bowmanii]MBU3190005.1 carbohydrate ABC transporter permease [Clostridium bowmanii]MCA1074560.1 carbohydrate ABC transporter permease [Clostridium bowmanii]